MTCWICGAEGDTGEHRIKASDLRSRFGHISQDKPIFFHDAQRRNQRIKGLRVSLLKFDSPICAGCNNDRTSPHDKAWERLSTFLSGKDKHIRNRKVLNLSAVFPGSVKRSLLDVHLYFVKLFGCIVAERGIAIPIQPFSTALITNTAHPNIYIAIGPSLSLARRPVGFSDLETVSLDGRIRFASWFYVLDTVSVNIMYAEPEERRNGLVNAWHPKKITKCLHLKEF